MKTIEVLKNKKISKVVLVTFVMVAIVWTLVQRNMLVSRKIQTGVKLPTQEELGDQHPFYLFFSLMEQTPVIEDGFAIRGNFDKVRLEILLKEPVVENKQKFIDWQQSNGYGDIPSEKIVYFVD